MSNLLNKDILETASGSASMYVVYQGKDWQMQLDTLLKLVTKDLLNLSNVDNTADLKKPISEAVADALNQKADKDSTPTLEAFEQLAQSLSNYVTTEALTTAIQGVMDAQNVFLTKEQSQAMVDASLAPIVQSLQEFNLVISNTNARLQALEQNNADDVSHSELTEAIQQALIQAGQMDTAAIHSLDLRFEDLEFSLQQLSNSFNTLKALVENHTHAASEIEGLTEFVEGVLSDNGVVVSKSNEW